MTADVLDGYGLAAPELVERLLRAGAVGCNIEDADHSSPGSLVDPGRAADRLAAVRAAADAAGIPLVLNARTDVLRLRGPAAVDDVLDRAARYLAAGADCIYPVGLRDPEVVRTLTASLDAPVNANASDAASIAAVGAAGAARVSLGPTAFSRAYAALDLVAAELLS